MTSENKTNYALIFTILITLAGWGVTFGICQQKIETNARDITKLEEKQNNTDVLLNSINTQLIELNTKMSLLIDGKIQ